jgi:hypothetical protein
MQSDPLSQLPLLSDWGRTPEDLLEALRDSSELPKVEIALSTLFAPDIEADIVEVIERARREELDGPSATLFFRGIHILGGRRLTAAYRPFIAFLREAEAERIAALLGDAVGDSLGKILAGLFDGDADLLFALITDMRVDDLIRRDAFGALAFLTFEGRIERALTEDFLERFDNNNGAPPGDMSWDGWMSAIGLLGLERLSPRVHAAFNDKRVLPWIAVESHYTHLLDVARSAPTDPERFEDEGLGYISDTLECLQDHWIAAEVAEEEAARLESEEAGLYGDVADDPLDWLDIEEERPSYSFDPPETVHNPYRDVGRNDPCPCGSGKKFKRCCMLAQ